MLRSGEVTSFPALLRRVLEDVRQDTAFSPNGPANNTNGKAAAATNGASDENGVNGNGNSSSSSSSGSGKKGGDATNGAATINGNASDRPSLAIPQTVVDEALKVTRDCLDSVCEIDESGAT
jgi:hypothetical protein